MINFYGKHISVNSKFRTFFLKKFGRVEEVILVISDLALGIDKINGGKQNEFKEKINRCS